MSKLPAILFGTALVALSSAVVAQSPMQEPKMMPSKEMAMKGMDANNDGMVSKDEFMKYHESMWNKMKKNPTGMAMSADVDSMYAGVVPSAIPGEPPRKVRP